MTQSDPARRPVDSSHPRSRERMSGITEAVERGARWVSASADSLIGPVGAWVFFVSFAGQGIRDLLGFWGYGVVVTLTGLALAAVFMGAGRRVTLRRLPLAPCAFVVVCCLSVLWSAYKVETVGAAGLSLITTAGGILLAIAFPLDRMLFALTRALQWTLGLSLALELFVAVVIGHRIPPLYMLKWAHVPELSYWVNGALFRGGPIQGFVGNRNPLAFIALLMILCLVTLWLAHRIGAIEALVWIALSVLVLALTRSATVFVALFACIAVVAVALVLRAASPARRPRILRVAVILAVMAVIAGVLLHDSLTGLLGRDPDMTGRSEIWHRVLFLWRMHPITGWGWIMYWVPWIPMFRYLVIRPDGTPTVQSHNAYIEALFQTGIIGCIVLVAAVLWVTISAFRIAVKRLDTDILCLAPTLFMTAMVVQSFSESRLLSEGNWLLFTAIATWITVRAHTVEVTALPLGRIRRRVSVASDPAAQDMSCTEDHPGRVPIRSRGSR